MTHLHKLVLFALTLAIGVMSGTPWAQADDKVSVEACFSAHEKSQVLRLESKLLETRDVLRECSNAACPSLVRADCVSWLAEIQRAIPSIIFQAEVDGEDVVDVKVYRENSLLMSKLDGRAIEFNPGAIPFRFETKKFEPKSQVVVLREGEKNRVVRVEFRTAPKPGSPGFQFQIQQVKEPRRPIPLMTYVLGGAAIAAGGTSVLFAMLAKQDRDKANKDCGDHCPNSVVDPIRTKLNVGTYAAIGAGAAAAGAIIFYMLRPEVKDEEKPGTKGDKDKKESEKIALPLDVWISGDGASVRWGGVF